LALAQYCVGLAYYKGDGLPQNYVQAAAWYRKAAEQGLSSAQNNLAAAYHKGQGVPLDPSASASWYRKAADRGDSNGEYNLAADYYMGDGLPQDYVKAFFWSSLAVHASSISVVHDAQAIQEHAREHLSPSQLRDAQKLLAQWQPIN
jgi:hypothetical protein